MEEEEEEGERRGRNRYIIGREEEGGERGETAKLNLECGEKDKEREGERAQKPEEIERDSPM